MKSAMPHRRAAAAACMTVLLWAGSVDAATPIEQVLAAADHPEEVIFAVRKQGKDGHWYANFGYYAPDEKRVAYTEGGWLRKLNLRTGVVTNLLADARGGFRDPVLSHDLDRLVFSWRKGGENHYHLWQCDLQGRNLKQLTDGPWDDIEPCIMPDDSIVFVSTRCKRWVNCWLTQVATLHRCEPDGSGIRAISENIEHDNTPWPLPDGRILHQRWEYIDRSQVDYHHLWTCNPDGTNQINFYGNQNAGLLMIDAKPVTGSPAKVESILSPGHGKPEHQGKVAIIDPRLGPDDPNAVRYLTNGEDFRDPWAFSESALIAARKGELLAIDGAGKTQIIHQLPAEELALAYQLHEPRPVIKRPRERIIPSRIDLSQTTGKLILSNILEGRNMQGVRPGEIRKLLVMEPLPKPINYTGGMDPMTYGGSFTLERIVGTVPVEEDGSAYIELPAGRNFFFVALDEDDLAVKRMQSFVSIQPGQVMSCVGCHEQRTRSSLPSQPLRATNRPASKPVPIAGVPEVIDYPRDIQPIFDKACIGCHDYQTTEQGGPYAGKLILSGDHGPMFSHSYFMLTAKGLFSDGRDRALSNYAPRTLGSSASKLLTFIDGSHHDVTLDAMDRTKLRLWIEAAATYPGTYAALGTGSIGGYIENEQVQTDNDWPTTRAGADVIGRRCSNCHQDDKLAAKLPRSLSDERGMSFWRPRIPHPAHATNRHIVFNLSRPERSLLLLAPLSPQDGGFGSCRNPDGTSIISNRQDPDYGTLLAMITAGQERLNAMKRFDMPGFTPHPAYLREMKRFGILPADPAPDARIDPYDTDARYWRSLWHQPQSPQPE